MKSTSFIMNFVMLAIFVTLVAIASQYPPQARFMPFVVGIPAIVLCLVQIALDMRAARRPVEDVEDNRSDVEKAQDEVSRYAGRQVESEVTSAPTVAFDAIPENQVHREVLLWSYFLGLIGSILVFGFWVTIPIFLAIFLRREAKLSWIRTVLTTVIGAGVLYLGVEKGLRVNLHDGFLTEYLMDMFGA